MKRVLLTIEYDGSSYYGWQKQPQFKTVQGELEKAIEKITGTVTEVFASGRTDAGVHALAQTAHFDINVPIPISKLADVLNSLLPDDIAVKKACYVEDDFHARFSIKSKTYQYCVYIGEEKKALQAKYMASEKYPLDLGKMQEASKIFLGEHNFKGYCSSQAITNDFTRTIYSLNITKKKDVIYFEIEGSGFLYNMVRIIVGTLVDIGRGRLTVDSAVKALETGDRSYAGVTMIPNGLYLKATRY